MKKIIAISIVLLIVAISYLIILLRFSCRKYNCISAPFINNLKEKEIYENTSDNFRGLYESSEGYVRIERHRTNEKDASTLTQITLMKIQGLFENARSPYPGPLSDEITCDQKFKLVPKTSQNKDLSLTSFSGYLNNRMQYGTCVDNQVTYKAYSALFYCANHSSLYQLELIIPITKIGSDENYFNLLNQISCQRQSFVLSGIFQNLLPSPPKL